MMSSPYNLPDYVTKFFEFMTLTQIYGKPSVKSLLQLFGEMKQNSQTAWTTLGGGKHGYIALILGPEVYNFIATTTEFTRPEDPGNFVIRLPSISRATPTNPDPVAPLLTSAGIHIQKATYDICLRQFNECQAIKLSLKNQITDALENDYLSALRDSITDMTLTNILAIFEFLQANYGKISPNLLMEKEDALKDQIYETTELINSVFDKVGQFANLYELIKDPLLDRRKIMLAYKIISKNNAFMNSLKTCNRKPLQDTFFLNMKIFFRE